MKPVANTIKISDLRKNTAVVISEVQRGTEAFLILSRSKPVMVVMSYSVYEKLQKGAEGANHELFDNSMDALINFSKPNRSKKFNAVSLVRSLRG